MDNPNTRRIYIIGAGIAGTSIAREIQSKGNFGVVVAFLDDDPAKIGRNIDGIPILGPIKDVATLLKTCSADEAIIAIPGSPREYLRELYSILVKAGFSHIKIVPGISQILDGSAHLVQARQIDPQDLLGRTPVAIGLKESLSYLRGKRVLVSGAGGSIGGELCRQLLSGGAERLYLFGHGENSIYQIDRELRLLQAEGVGEKATIVPIIGDLKDSEYMRFILGRLKADVVFHAAAYKHVPMMEENPVAAIENNVLGTRNLLEACKIHEVQRFVLISTDKAVEPVSVYGASKYLCEKLLLQYAGEAKEKQRYMIVRFGNVLGSRGSIMPLFQRQIEMGGPVTVTHPEASRWFMTIPEACSLVLKAGGVGENDTLYILDMGEPIKIRELAEQMIRFYGFEPGKDIKIEYIGLRHGERIDERLYSSDEEPVKTEYQRIHRVQRNTQFDKDLLEGLQNLELVCRFNSEKSEYYRSRERLWAILKSLVPTVIMPEHETSY